MSVDRVPVACSLAVVVVVVFTLNDQLTHASVITGDEGVADVGDEKVDVVHHRHGYCCYWSDLITDIKNRESGMKAKTKYGYLQFKI